MYVFLFKALGIIDLIDSLTDVSDEDLDIQIDVFYELKQKDEELLSQDAEDGLLLASHQEVVAAILEKVINFGILLNIYFIKRCSNNYL